MISELIFSTVLLVRCLPLWQSFPPERHHGCRPAKSSSLNQPNIVIQCCRDRDFCNIEYPLPSLTFEGEWSVKASHLHVLVFGISANNHILKNVAHLHFLRLNLVLLLGVSPSLSSPVVFCFWYIQGWYKLWGNKTFIVSKGTIAWSVLCCPLASL